MPWFRGDDHLDENPKIVGLSDRAFRAYIEGICYAARNLTDGFLPPSVVARRWPRARAELLAAELWHPDQGGGVWVHDYLVYNPSRADTMAKREAERARKTPQAGPDSVRIPPGSDASLIDPVPEPLPKPSPDPSSKGADAPSKNPSDMQATLLDRLHDLEGWGPLTFGALVKLNGKWGRPIVTMALQRAREENQTPNGSAYGLLESMCADITEKQGATA